MAGPALGVGLAQHQPASTRASVAWASTTSTSSTRTGYDFDTPLEETMGALDTAVRQGKALYVGISSYSAVKTAEAAAILRGLGTPFVIHQLLVLAG